MLKKNYYDELNQSIDCKDDKKSKCDFSYIKINLLILIYQNQL